MAIALVLTLHIGWFKLRAWANIAEGWVNDWHSAPRLQHWANQNCIWIHARIGRRSSGR